MVGKLKSTDKRTLKVIDPFVDVGTILIACKKLGIDADGIEIRQGHVDESKIYLRRGCTND